MSLFDPSKIPLDSFDDVLADFKAGKPVVLVDDEDRENEGDVVFATEAVTPELVAFLMREARGLICVSVTRDIARRLHLPYQVLQNNSPFQTPFAITLEHREVVPFGVSASGRTKTMKSLINEHSSQDQFVTPGHVFPLIAHDAGVLGRRGHTEGVVDMARLAGLKPSGVLCEILNPDGTVARGEQLVAFAQRHGLRLASIEQIRAFRAANEISVRLLSTERVETDYGSLLAMTFMDDAGGREHIAMVKGDVASMPASYAPLVRVHSECLTGDVFGSRRCDCGPQLAGAMQMIGREGAGVLLYLRQEGRGIGLENKLKAYLLQDQGLDTVEANLSLGFAADERDFAVGAHMLLAMGVTQIRLITNNPRKSQRLEKCGVTVKERVSIFAPRDPYSEGYLKTKKEKLGHLL